MKNFMRSGLSARILSICATMSILFTHCRKDGEIVEQATESSLSVSVDNALKVASTFNKEPTNKGARVAANAVDSLFVDTKETYTKSGIPIFHIINYKGDKGWILVSADKRMTPVLAYSQQASIPLPPKH